MLEFWLCLGFAPIYAGRAYDTLPDGVQMFEQKPFGETSVLVTDHLGNRHLGDMSRMMGNTPFEYSWMTMVKCGGRSSQGWVFIPVLTLQEVAVDT